MEITSNNNHIVYKVLNTQTGEVYVGTTTDSVHQRKLDHTERAMRGEKNKFHQAIKTYGTKAFEWTQIDTANSIDDLAQKEKQYIFEYKSKEDGYNSDLGGGFKKTIYQYNRYNGKLINTFDSLESASNAVNSSRKSISNACLGYNKFCRGFLWSYNKTEDFEQTFDLRKKIVGKYSIEGVLLVEYSSVSDASRLTGISKTCISRCCRGERAQTGGFHWKYN